MSWLYLVLAIILEVAGTTCMKLSDALIIMGVVGLNLTGRMH
jgi:multidrug transporter EmrE-like cation transporter